MTAATLDKHVCVCDVCKKRGMTPVTSVTIMAITSQ